MIFGGFFSSCKSVHSCVSLRYLRTSISHMVVMSDMFDLSLIFCRRRVELLALNGEIKFGL